MFKQTNIIKNLPANTSYMLDFAERQKNSPGFISSIPSWSNGVLTVIHTWNSIEDHYNFLKDNEPRIELGREVTAPSGKKVLVRVAFGVEFFRPFF